MDLTENFIEEIAPQLEDPDMAYEDYAYVLIEARKLGFKKAQAWCWCDGCDDEFEVEVDIETLEWTCPHCNKTSTN